MPFGSNRFSNAQNNFGGSLNKTFNPPGSSSVENSAISDNPFKFTPKDASVRSRIRYYDRDALWTRWRRGYELYTLTQSVFGATGSKRADLGDFRSYCAFQQYPGIFIPARLFTYPSQSGESGEHIVAMRDANSFNFYDFGIPILAVRYLGDSTTVAYSQTGTTITVSYPNHGFQLADNIYLTFLSGTAVTATLPIVSKTNDSFTCTAIASATTIGNVSVALSTIFTDDRWTEIRTKLRFLPVPVASFPGERFTDRISERDPGLSATYSRTGSLVTVTCSTQHGIATGNEINFTASTGNAGSGLYVVTVTSSTQFTFSTIDSGSTTGSAIVYRLIKKFNYEDYVGYTVKSIDNANNEIVFQRADSYGVQTVNNTPQLADTAHRGFTVGNFLTTELRYQCTCQDFTKRSSYNFYANNFNKRFPDTAITSVKPGTFLNKDNSITDLRESPGVFADLGYISTANFKGIPDYNDTAEKCYTNLMYYQMRWCKHIYASLFSLVHDEGNIVFSIAGKYEQDNTTGITVTADNHGLTENLKVQIKFTSGNALSGQYTINQVIDANRFVIAYPYVQITSGYCNVENLKEHDYIKTWLLEPTDHPVGDGSDTFYKNLVQENTRLRKGAERLAMMKMGKAWEGSTDTLNFQNQPQNLGNFKTYLLSSLLTDSVIRDASGALSTSGTPQNSTQRLISIVSKVVNLEPTLILSTKFGFLNQPLVNYVANYQFGLILGGEYLNGAPLEDPASVTIIDCSTYDPITAQDTLVDCGLYGL